MRGPRERGGGAGGRGSAITFPAGSSGTTRRTPAGRAFVRISVRAGGASADTRSSVSRSIGSLVTSGSSCFGRSGVLIGQKREPMPPASTTIQTRAGVAHRRHARSTAHVSMPVSSATRA